MKRTIAAWYTIYKLNTFIAISLLFEPRDLWIGVYWNYKQITSALVWPHTYEFDLYICLVPLFPLRLHIVRVDR